ncbi:MAG TPA: hypothetical protein PK724_08445, partial [Pseudomonadales bacterium]|nr:hypothetical protein [Pseudomonadales bacterium]
STLSLAATASRVAKLVRSAARTGHCGVALRGAGRVEGVIALEDMGAVAGVGGSHVGEMAEV